MILGRDYSTGFCESSEAYTEVPGYRQGEGKKAVFIGLERRQGTPGRKDLNKHQGSKFSNCLVLSWAKSLGHNVNV